MKKLYNRFFNTPQYFKIPLGPIAGQKLFLAPRHGYKKIIGIYEKKIVYAIMSNIQKSDICFDLGSHVGYLSLIMSRKVGKNGLVVAIDPVVECCELLGKSIQKNKIKNIKVLNIGVGDKNINKKAYVFEDSAMANFEDSGFKIYKGKANTLFVVKKLDDIWKDLKLKKISFIKMDIEGYEYKALLGAKNVLKQKPILLIEIHGFKDYKNIYYLLKKNSYDIFDLDGNEIIRYKKKTKKITHILAK